MQTPATTKLTFIWAATDRCEPDIQCTDRNYKKDMRVEAGKKGSGHGAGQYIYWFLSGTPSTCPTVA